MKTIFIIMIFALGAAGFYYNFYEKGGSLKNVIIEGNTITVDAGNLTAVFSPSKELNQVYMLFGGGYFREKNLINPVSLSGLEIVDAKNIYSRYPDFYRCNSAGASLAKPLVKHLNLIPANPVVLKELRESIAEFEDNLASGGDRVCVLLGGSALDMQAARFSGDNKDIKDQLPVKDFYLIRSSTRVHCKNLLGRPS